MKYPLYGLTRCILFAEPGDFAETSSFGERIHPITGVRKFHAGIDGALWDGKELKEATICAACDGRVVEIAADIETFSRENPRGNFVTIDHGGGYVTIYMHLEHGSLRVALGDYVKRGTPLGYMGKTGLSTGEHIHFQLEKDRNPIDPKPLILGGSLK